MRTEAVSMRSSSQEEDVFEDAPSRLEMALALPVVVAADAVTRASPAQELLAAAAMRKPLGVLSALPQLLLGKTTLADELAHRMDLSRHPLPLREDLIQWLSDRAGEGHDIYLLPGKGACILDRLSDRLAKMGADIMVAEVPAGRSPALLLQELFPAGFIYVGDERTDIAVWQAAEGAVLAGATPAAARRVRTLGGTVLAQFRDPQLSPGDLLRALRAHHWSKNLLLFLPLILSHQWHSVPLIVQTIAAFLCLIAVTSATYLLNDLADLGADRLHWAKRHRALASGRLSIASGFGLAMILLVSGMASALLLSWPFAAALFSYLVLTLAYSAGLKSIPLLDTLIIGLLFTLRLVMGCTLIANPKPAWLLTFSVFFFFSLAVAKRHTEVLRAGANGSSVLRSRGYQPEDSPLTLTLGIAAALASLVVFFIFILLEMLPAKIYAQPEFLFAIPVALSIWMGRIWLLAHRGQMKDDPVSFALRDGWSLGLGAIVAVAFCLAL